MFTSKDESSELNNKGINALLGKGSEFDGKLVFEGTVRIDGKFTGEIISKDRLLIGDSAIVNAEIKVNTVIISGSITGNIYASSRVEIKAPGKVRGNVETPVLVVEEGVIFDGQCKMSKGETPFDHDKIKSSIDVKGIEIEDHSSVSKVKTGHIDKKNIKGSDDLVKSISNTVQSMKDKPRE